MEHHAKYTSYPQEELVTMARWITHYWRQRTDDRNQTVFADEVLGMSQPSFNQLLTGANGQYQNSVLLACVRPWLFRAMIFFAILVECPTYRHRLAKFLLDAELLRDLLGKHYKPFARLVQDDRLISFLSWW